MKKTFSESVIIYKLAILRGVMYSLLTLLSAFLAAVTCVDFPNISNWNKFLIIIGVLVTWLTTMLAFLDKSIASAKSQMETDATNPPSPAQPKV